MENTLENKSKFFALYWGQRICIINELTKTSLPSYASRNEVYLLLTPLHLISDEDAIEVAKFIGFDKGINEAAYIKVGNHVCKNILDGRMHMMNPIHAFNMLDYLRSKSYALPFNGVPVQEQVSRGWVKLKTE